MGEEVQSGGRMSSQSWGSRGRRTLSRELVLEGDCGTKSKTLPTGVWREAPEPSPHWDI